MNTQTIDERVRQRIAEQLGLSINDVVGDKKFIIDLGCDSLETVEIIMSIEDEFHIEISDEDAEKIDTVQQAIDYVNADPLAI